MTIPNAHSFESRVGFTAIRTLAIERFLEKYRLSSGFEVRLNADSKIEENQSIFG